MLNRFPGTCNACRKPCETGQGEAVKNAFGKWRITHLKCDPATAAATALAPAKRSTRPPYQRRRKFCGINPW